MTDVLDLLDPPASGAALSECGRYRYLLWRRWDDLVTPFRPMGFIMLNPSIADASVDDHTIRCCIRIAKREGCTGINVVNLFAWRSTDPRGLDTTPDLWGPDNNLMLERVLDVHASWETPLVAAWGASGPRLLAGERAKYVMSRAAQRGVPLWCLGATKTGHPRHPSRLSNDQLLEPFRRQFA